MANEQALPPEVTTLLHRSLPSMVHIELLLLLARTTPQAATRYALAQEVRSSPALVAAALEELEGSRLVRTVPGTDPTEHRFDDSDPAAVRAVAALQEEYDRRPVTLIKALYSRPTPAPAPSPMQAFADAFRIRSPDEP